MRTTKIVNRKYIIKKLIAVVLLFSLVLCGCGKSSDGGDKEKKVKDTKKAESQKDNKKQSSGKNDKPTETADASTENVNGWIVGYIDEIGNISSTHSDSYGGVLFNLLDINGDLIPELVAFDGVGYWASVSVYKDNQVITKTLYDNDAMPEGFTSYGAYGAIICDEGLLIRKEMDSTFDEAGGWNLPGSEWIGIPAVPFEYYEYLTMYKLNDDLAMEEIGKYDIHYHYEAADEYGDGPGESEFIEATYNGKGISEEEYAKASEKTWYSDVYFGSEQDRGEGYNQEEIIELLSDESFVYEPGTLYRGENSAEEASDIEPVYSDNVVVFADEALRIVAAEATSELNVTSKDNSTYTVSNLYDGDSATAWIEGVDGDGEGESITLHLDGVHRISQVKIYNGFLKTQKRYAVNGKVTKVIVDYGNGYEQESNVVVIYPPEEEIGFGKGEVVYTLINPEEEVSTDTIKITILEAIPGSQYHDTAISEIMIFGQ